MAQDIPVSQPKTPQVVSPHHHDHGLSYRENAGQWADWIDYRADLRAGDLLVHGNRLTYAFLDLADVSALHPGHSAYDTGLTVGAHIVRLSFPGAEPAPAIEPASRLPETCNYFIGEAPSQWAAGVRDYREVLMRGLYPGIDLRLHSDHAGNVKYNFELAPGAVAGQIALKFEGAEEMHLEDGALRYQTSVGRVEEGRPVAHQIIGGERVAVPVEYDLDAANNLLRYTFPEGYDTTETLIIDPPVLVFSTYTGATADNWGFTATPGLNGGLYSGGLVNNLVYGGGFPVTPGAYQTTFGGGTSPGTTSLSYASDMAIVKYDSTGTQRLYATYLGGSDNEQAHSIIANDQDELLIMGTTRSTNFPMQGGGLGGANAGGIDMVLARLSADGSQLLASTYIGGSGWDGINANATANPLYRFYADDSRGEIILGPDDSVYVASSVQSSDFPATANALDGTLSGAQDAIVFKTDQSFSAFAWCTYLGGNSRDAAYAVKVNSQNEVVVVGGTQSQGWLNSGGGWQPTYNGGPSDGYLTILAPDASAQIASTYLGTAAYDQAYLIEVDSSDNVYVAGQTSGNYPIQNVGYSNPNSGQFISKLTPNLSSLVYSTRFGSGSGTPDITLTAFLVDICGNVYISGWGSPTLPGNSGSTAGLPTTNDAFQPVSTGSDFYLIVFHTDIDSLFYATFIGDPNASEHVDGGTSRFDKQGIVYQSVCASCGGTNAFPTTNGAFSASNNSPNCNNASFKFEFDVLDITNADFDFSVQTTQGCAPFTVNFQNQSTVQGNTPVDFFWEFGDSAGTTSTQTNPSITYTNPGIYTVDLTTSSTSGCVFADSASQQIFVYAASAPDFDPIINDCDLTVQFDNQTFNGTTYRWEFGDGDTSDALSPMHTYATPGTYNVKLLVNPGSLCEDSLTIPVTVSLPPSADFQVNKLACSLTSGFQNASTNDTSLTWQFGDGSTLTGVAAPQHTYALPGQYTVRLIANAGSPCPDTTAQTITVDSNAVADFEVQAPECDSVVTFTDSSYNADTYSWQFGDGQTSTSQNPTHIYTDAGSYNARLIINAGTNCADTTVESLSIDRIARAGFLPVVFSCATDVPFLNTSSNGLNYLWTLAPGGTSFTAEEPIAPIDTSGTYVMTQIVNPGATCPDTLVDTFAVEVPSRALFEAPENLCDSLLSVTNQSEKATEYVWELREAGGQTPLASSTAAEPDFSLPTPGNYALSLTTNPSSPCPGFTERRIRRIASPTPDFVSEPLERCSRTLEFRADTTGGSQFQWRFGTGDSAAGAQVFFTFPADSTYEVTLVVDADSLCPDSLTRAVAAGRAQTETAFDIPDSLCGQRLVPVDRSENVLTYEWGLSSGDTATGPAPAFDLPGPGAYSLRLVTDAGTLCEDTAQASVLSLAAPVADFEIAQETCSPVLDLTATGSPADSLLWDFGDGVTAEGSTVSHAYDAERVRVIRLISVANNGCRDTAVREVDYDPLNLGATYWPNVFTPNGDGTNDEWGAIRQSAPCIEEVIIFDRWGLEVFRTRDPEGNPWDGTIPSGVAPEGVYVYLIRTIGGTERAGTVTLLR